jgi:hypothetical protein
VKGAITPPPVFPEKAPGRAIEPTVTLEPASDSSPESPSPAAELTVTLEPYEAVPLPSRRLCRS